jgi:thymidylate kinase
MLTVVGYQKALKMIKSELFSLSNPTIGNTQKIDKKLINDLKKNVRQVIKGFNAYLIHNCDVFKNFTGRDIDALYKKHNYFNKVNNSTIIRNLDNSSLRIHLNHLKNKNFLSLDIEDISSMSKVIRNIFKKNFDTKVYCKHTKLNHLDQKSIIFYKLVKYFYYGTIHSYSQLLYLKKDIKKLNKSDFNLIVNSIEEVLPNEEEVIKKFLFWKFNKFYRNNNNKKFFFNKRLNRHKKRKIFSGKLNFKKLIFSKKFIYALLLGSNAKWKYSHNPMPAISIIGNDGSGKTTVVDHIRKKFSKMDPLIFDMKASVPFFSITHKIRIFLKKIKKSILVKKIYFFNTIISIIGEIIDLFDKYIKFKIGMAWADAGYGLTIFERYPTDRIRGEFPNTNNKLLPLEQFFPFPDGIIYLDVLPQDSVNRKKEDNHTLEEMKSKRENYLTLLKEFDEVKFLPPSKNLNDKILKIKNYIFKIYEKKKIQIKKEGKTKRIKWKKNFNRVLAGSKLDKSQKEGFFE